MCWVLIIGSMNNTMDDVLTMPTPKYVPHHSSEIISLMTLDDLCTWAAIHTTNKWHLLANHSLEAMLDAFDHLNIAFHRKAHGMVTCVVTTYYGDTNQAKGMDHILAAYRAVYKCYNNIEGRVRNDYYQRYV